MTGRIDLEAAVDVFDAIEEAGGTVEDFDVEPGDDPADGLQALIESFAGSNREPTTYTFEVTIAGDTNDVVEPIRDPDGRVVDEAE